MLNKPSTTFYLQFISVLFFVSLLIIMVHSFVQMENKVKVYGIGMQKIQIQLTIDHEFCVPLQAV